MHERSIAVEEAVLEAQKIREAVEDLAQTQDKALMKAYGISDTNDSSDSCPEEDEDLNEPFESNVVELPADISSTLVSLLAESHYNWFEFHAKSIVLLEGRTKGVLAKFFTNILHYGFNDHKLDLIKQSRDAYIAAEAEDSLQHRIADSMKGEVFTDSESDNPESYVGLDLFSDTGRKTIAKKRAAVSWQARRLQAKLICENGYLCNQTLKRVSKMLQECPDIGKTIKLFVQDKMWVWMPGTELEFLPLMEIYT